MKLLLAYEQLFRVDVLLDKPFSTCRAEFGLHHVCKCPLTYFVHDLVLVDVFISTLIYSDIENISRLEHLVSVEVTRVEPSGHVQICKTSIERILSPELFILWT